MKAKDIRQSFLDFFASKGHKIVPSAPVIPHGDPTLLFTNAGMNQFKDVFLGISSRDYTRAVDTQKCIRVSGKHNDIEEVGVDTYHHTFFEMLGNWSFNDYYKEEAIAWAWELLTNVWHLPENRLYATVYRTDDESFNIWKKYLPENKVLRFDEKDNFWEMGETGPCGPCSEIHYDRTPDLSGLKLVNAGSPDVIEIWNLVFIQYNRKENGELVELKAKYVDTGMGFERVTAVIQGKSSNYDTDIFQPIIQKIEELSHKKYPIDNSHPDGIAMRVLADHVRTLSTAIADGALPSNEGRGYVLRRILRRAARYGRNLGFHEPILYKLVPSVIETLGDTFPELKSSQLTIEKVIKAEEEAFLGTLERGLVKFSDILSKAETQKTNTISGEDAFLLYDTFGFPLDLTQLLAKEQNMNVDSQGFESFMHEQSNRSRQARKNHTFEILTPGEDFKTEFTGYDKFEDSGRVLWTEENKLILDRTCLYAESGGQVADKGTIILGGEIYNVVDVQKVGSARLIVCDRNVEPLIGEIAISKVDIRRRKLTMKNHSATHLLHQALRQVLGNHIKQAGSLVSPDYLRFDFNHFQKISNEEIKEIEAIVNEKILEAHPVNTQEIPLDEARKNPDIKMYFDEKYGDIVRVITMDPKFSIELCGGTHVRNTSEIGLFKIKSEGSIASGVRRIEAITSIGIEEYIYELEDTIANKDAERQEILERIKHLEKSLNQAKLSSLQNIIDKSIESARQFDGVLVATSMIEDIDIDSLRQLGDEMRNKLHSNGIGLLATVNDQKVQLCCVVTDDVKNKYPAGKLVNLAAQYLGGSGGGRPHLATAGAKDVSKLPDLIANFTDLVLKQFSNI